MPKISAETKVLTLIIGATLLIIAGAAAFLGRGGENKPVDNSILVRAGSRAQGPENAQVVIVEFSDYECPACKAAHPVLKIILEKYRDKIRFVYRHYPLPSHKYAFLAAQAAEAAGQQTKFWEMHDKLFEKSPDLSRDKLPEYARELGLDIDRFSQNFDADAIRQKILSDQADGNRVKLRATPTFFINGAKFEGTLTVGQFSQEIEKRL